MSIVSRVRNLNIRYNQRLNFLQKEYEEELSKLQVKCTHENSTDWEYKVDIKGQIASTEEGLLIKYKECRDCGFNESKTDDRNDYNSVVLF